METVYYGECHHLFCDNIKSSDCLKRYFDISDPIHNINIRIAVCSDYIRLKLKNKAVNDEHWDKWNRNERKYRDIVEEIIDDVLYDAGIRTGNKVNTPTGYGCDEYVLRDANKVSYPICFKPYIYLNTSLREAIDYIISDKVNFNYSSYVLKHIIDNKMELLCAHYSKYAKYKKYRDAININLKRVLKYGNVGRYRRTDEGWVEDYKLAYTDLFTLLFEIQTKFINK